MNDLMDESRGTQNISEMPDFDRLGADSGTLGVLSNDFE
jgi:hypothetical protein